MTLYFSYSVFRPGAVIAEWCHWCEKSFVTKRWWKAAREKKVNEEFEQEAKKVMQKYIGLKTRLCMMRVRVVLKEDGESRYWRSEQHLVFAKESE